MSLVDDRPAQRGELVEERLFDVEVLRHDGSRKCQVFSETARPSCAHLTYKWSNMYNLAILVTI